MAITEEDRKFVADYASIVRAKKHEAAEIKATNTGRRLEYSAAVARGENVKPPKMLPELPLEDVLHALAMRYDSIVEGIDAERAAANRAKQKEQIAAIKPLVVEVVECYAALYNAYVTLQRTAKPAADDVFGHILEGLKACELGQLPKPNGLPKRYR